MSVFESDVQVQAYTNKALYNALDLADKVIGKGNYTTEESDWGNKYNINFYLNQNNRFKLGKAFDKIKIDNLKNIGGGTGLVPEAMEDVPNRNQRININTRKKDIILKALKDAGETLTKISLKNSNDMERVWAEKLEGDEYELKNNPRVGNLSYNDKVKAPFDKKHKISIITEAMRDAARELN